MRLVTLLAFALVPLAAAPAHAQAVEPIAAGARVRLWAAGVRDARPTRGAAVARADAVVGHAHPGERWHTVFDRSR